MLITLADVWTFLHTQEGWWAILMFVAIVGLFLSQISRSYRS